MSDNEDLLGDDLGDHSLADYNLGNEEEEQLLADDYESSSSQNVPASVGPSYGSGPVLVSPEYPEHSMDYGAQPISYQPAAEPECVVPNIIVEIPNTPIPDHSTYAPYEPPAYEVEHAVVPPAIPAAPLESPQIVPSDVPLNVSNGDSNLPRERFTSERAPGSQRLPQIRDIPDSLDKVVIPRGGFGSRGRTSWRNPHAFARHPHASHPHPYRRHNVHRGNFNQRPSFPPPQLRPSPPQMRPEIRPEMRHEMRPDILPEMHSDMRPDMHSDMRLDIRPDMRPLMHPDARPDMRPDGRPEMHPDGLQDMRPGGPPDIHPDGRQNMRSDNRPDMRLDGRPDMRLDGRPDMRLDGRPDMRIDGRPDMRIDGRPDMRQDGRPDLRLDGRPDMRLDGRLDIRPDGRPDMRLGGRPDIRPDFPPDMRPDFPPDMRPDFLPDMRPELRHEPPPHMPHQMGPEISPERPLMPDFRQDIRPFGPRFQFRPNMNEPRFRPNFEPRPMFYRPNFNPRPFGPPIREIIPNNNMPQVTIRQPLPGLPLPKMDKFGPKPREQEVIMLPVQLPPNLPPGGLAGKKVLINPHFKGNFQPPVEGLPAYIPTRIQKTPPLSPTLESKFGPVKDIDDAAERFIAEQRNALARAANRKIVRRSPQRFIENTTIEIENDLMGGGGAGPGAVAGAGGPVGAPAGGPVGAPARRSSDDELLRRQEQFISANRAGLRRRMRSPSPIRRSPSPRRSPDRFDRERPDRADRADRERDRRHRPDATAAPPRTHDEESEYRRRVREQESLRERVLRAKELRRRRHAVALHAQLQERDRERQEREKESKPEQTSTPPDRQADKQSDKPPTTESDNQPDTTRKSPEKTDKIEKIEQEEKIRDRSPVKDDSAEVNSTCENLTPPRPPSPERALTPPLPGKGDYKCDSDDDLDLILGDIDGILSDDEDTGRFKEKAKPEPAPPARPAGHDLRARIGGRARAERPDRAERTERTERAERTERTERTERDRASERRPRQKIVFHEDKEDKRKRDKSPPRRAVVTSSTKTEDSESTDKKTKQVKSKPDTSTNKSRQRITYDSKEQKEKEKEKDDDKKQSFSNRRVILQRKITQTKEVSKSVFSRIETKSDPTKPNPGIFSRAVRTAIGSENTRIVIKKHEEPQVEFESDSEVDEDKLLEEEIGNVAEVTNLPHGMTDTRLKTLAGNDVQSLSLDKEERSAKITFKTTLAAEHFKKKFNNKMVAASRLTVSLR